MTNTVYVPDDIGRLLVINGATNTRTAAIAVGRELNGAAVNPLTGRVGRPPRRRLPAVTSAAPPVTHLADQAGRELGRLRGGGRDCWGRCFLTGPGARGQGGNGPSRVAG